MAKHHSKSSGKEHHAQHMHIHKHGKKKGGRVGIVAAGNKDVLEEANEDKDGDETGHEKNRGGKVSRKKGGKVVGLMTGGSVRARLDRPGRKRGGAVGSNTSPLSTAHAGGHGADGSSNPKDTYGGTPA